MKRLLIFFFLSILIKAEIFDISIPENDTASYTYADFRIWINDSTDTLRGIYWFMHPNNGDSRDIVTDTAYQNLAQGQNFAVLGAHIFNMHMDTGIGDAVIAAMDSFAILSQHQELSFIPFFINGYSWGGQFAYHFTQWKPERIVGFITQKGGYHDTTNAELAIQVPALMIVGENDLDYRIENLTNIFLNHRPEGAKWILAMEPGVGHSLVTDYTFLNSFTFADVSKIEELLNIIQKDLRTLERAVYSESFSQTKNNQNSNDLTPKETEDIPYECVIKGDGKYKSIAAASILAKTYRDEYMEEIHREHPEFDWKKNKGYPTKRHRSAIAKHGATKYHRKSFKLLPEARQLSLF